MSGPSNSGYDVIVVGSGPGGATVARELSRRGATVLILEWGPGGEDRGTVGQFLRQGLVPGRSFLLTHGMLGLLRGVTTGGSSLFYYATAFPVPFDMLATHGVDLREDVGQIRRELPIAPLAPAMMTPMAQRIMASARSLGLDWRPLDKLIRHDRWRPGRPFGFYGDPERVKWTAREFVEDAVSHGAVIRNGARVTRVLVQGGAATGVEYRRRGRIERAAARTVVISAGGIGSPVILRASGIPEAGFDLFFDPLLTVSGRVRDVALRRDEIPMSAGAHFADEGYVMTDMASPRLVHALFEAEVGRLDRVGAYASTARIMVKVRDELGGRVTARGGVRKRLSALDLDRFRSGRRRAEQILETIGAVDIHRSWFFASHPGGTVKLGELVDANLESRIRRLHVCDCSVIPGAWGLPPTLTIVGLGRYLARRLSGDTISVPEEERRPVSCETA